MLNRSTKTVLIGDQTVGINQPVYIVAEIGINHNGNLEIAKHLIDAAVAAGCNAVKFQKRTPKLCVPAGQKKGMRQTPWGYISYLDYRNKVEFGQEEYKEIDRYCRRRGIAWFASAWDKPSIDFIEQFAPPCYKIPSAMLTDVELLKQFRKTGRPIILSTGMSSMKQIKSAVNLLGTKNLILTHSTSVYPCPPEQLNLRIIQTLMKSFDCPIGYSGHEIGIAPTVAAVALGATYIERHITLDRTLWGTDQAVSLEVEELMLLVKHIRTVESALGDGVKKVYESERSAMKKLRKKNTL